MKLSRAEGLVEGKAEERIWIAKKMLQQNITIENISKITGLNTQEIKELEITNNLYG